MVSSRLCGFLLLAVLLFEARSVSAQNWNEIFKQKSTQKKYLLQQIAALQIYIGYAKKGYDIVGGGIHMVKDISGGEFSLHRNFFASLAFVNPAIRNSSQVAEIVSYQLGVVSALRQWRAADLNPDEWVYLSLVKSNLLAGCAADLEELFLVITSGKLEMKDDERLQRLDSLLLSMQEKYQFTASFTADLVMLYKQKIREQESINQIGRLYEIN